MHIVEIGNDSAIEGYRNPGDEELHFRALEGERITTVGIPEECGLEDAIKIVRTALTLEMAADGIPLWFQCDSSPDLQGALLQQYNLPKKAGGRPSGYGDPEHPTVGLEGEELPAEKPQGEPQKVVKARKAVKKAAKVQPSLLTLHLSMLWGLLVLGATRLHLRTNTGRDWQARVMGDSSSTGTGAYGSGSYMGVSTDNSAPDAARTSLPGEILTGTLARKQAAYSHTNGTAAYSLVAVWTFDQDAILYKLGIFNAAGTLIFESLLNAAIIGKPGDTSTLTSTITI